MNQKAPKSNLREVAEYTGLLAAIILGGYLFYQGGALPIWVGISIMVGGVVLAVITAIRGLRILRSQRKGR